MTSHLINLAAIKAAVKQNHVVALCHNEDNCVAFESLSRIPTTANIPITYGDTAQWDKKQAKVFKNAQVLVVSHRDGDWLQKTVELLKPVAQSINVLQIPDRFDDFLAWKRAGGDLKALQELPQEQVNIPAATTPATPKQKRPSREDYLGIIRGFFGDLRRDIFSNDLLFFDSFSNKWQPAINAIGPLRSEVRELAYTGDKSFKAGEVEDHLAYLERATEPRLVIDIPEPDSRDYIQELAQRIVLSDKQVAMGVDEQVFCELLKYWHCKMWKRLDDPTVRNEIFILNGGQNLGKDFWIRENCEALGQFLINFSIHVNERDTKEQLHRGLVMNISEFDRSSRVEVSLLKEIVTATQTDIRLAYDRRAASRPCYCSFIASTNNDDVFNDPTGHSRYVFFDVKFIDKSVRFTDAEKLMVLAQGRALAQANYKPSAHSLEVMHRQITELTPDDEYELLVDRWDFLATEFFLRMNLLDKPTFAAMTGDGQFSGYLPNDITYAIVDQLSKEFTKSPKKIRSTLKLRGRQRRDPTYGRGFYFKLFIQNQSNQDAIF